MPTVTVEKEAVVIKEHCAKRVVTFRDVDAVHHRPKDTARKAFNRNRDRFVQGEDYFVLKTDEAMSKLNYPAPNGLTLLTESGYLMLVKSFTDDLAWKVQRELVNCYFRQMPIAPLAAPVAPPKKSRPKVVDIPVNRDAQKLIADIRSAAAAIPEVMACYSRYNTRADADKYSKVITDLGMRLSGLCFNLTRIPLREIEMPE